MRVRACVFASVHACAFACACVLMCLQRRAPPKQVSASLPCVQFPLPLLSFHHLSIIAPRARSRSCSAVESADAVTAVPKPSAAHHHRHGSAAFAARQPSLAAVSRPTPNAPWRACRSSVQQQNQHHHQQHQHSYHRCQPCHWHVAPASEHERPQHRHHYRRQENEADQPHICTAKQLPRNAPNTASNRRRASKVSRFRADGEMCSAFTCRTTSQTHAIDCLVACLKSRTPNLPCWIMYTATRQQ